MTKMKDQSSDLRRFTSMAIASAPSPITETIPMITPITISVFGLFSRVPFFGSFPVFAESPDVSLFPGSSVMPVDSFPFVPGFCVPDAGSASAAGSFGASVV